MTSRPLIYLLLVIAAGILFWIGIDLFASTQSDLRTFHPDAVARLETDMWRSYYDRHELRLFLQLAEMLRTQYGIPFFRSNLIAFHAAKAAFIFKDGKSRSDYERALPDVIDYYESIRRVSSTPFSVEETAKLELEWWIIHRERESHSPEDLYRSLAELQAAIYEIPVARFLEHARLRGDAMLLRDAKWESGGVSESDWARIHELLRQSWRELWMEVQPQARSATS